MLSLRKVSYHQPNLENPEEEISVNPKGTGRGAEFPGGLVCAQKYRDSEFSRDLRQSGQRMESFLLASKEAGVGICGGLQSVYLMLIA